MCQAKFCYKSWQDVIQISNHEHVKLRYKDRIEQERAYRLVCLGRDHTTSSHLLWTNHPGYFDKTTALPSTRTLALDVSSPTLMQYSASVSKVAFFNVIRWTFPSTVISVFWSGWISLLSFVHLTGMSGLESSHSKVTVSPSVISLSVKVLVKVNGTSAKIYRVPQRVALVLM